MNKLSPAELIAPCGINCGVCLGYLREKNKCSGCRSLNASKPEYCNGCRIKNCEKLSVTKSKFCYDCSKFPCARLKQLEKRYRLRYNMSIFQNFDIIKTLGLDAFVLMEREKWKCNSCGGFICIHRGFCLKCGKK